jgi:hypothetical protein
MGPRDVDGLVALYGRLSADDLHRRFFSALRPSRTFLDHWARLSERGGFGLVAVLASGGGADEVVADAGYAPLPNGNAELAITVAPGWRGWLGPYVLDVLVGEAARRGVPNLEAEILATNGSMLALVRGRGHAVMGHPDWTIVRVVIGTSQRTPSWPPRHDRPRLLVEGAGTRWAGEEPARTAGYDVITCPGPGRDRRRCPLLNGGRCPLVDGADAVVVVVQPGPDPLGAALAGRHADTDTATPVMVEIVQPGATPPAAPATTRVFNGCTPSAAVIAAIDDALQRRPHAGTAP